MTITIGFAQGGKIIQSKTKPTIQLAGNFAANLGPTILTKLRTEWDNPLQLGLLTKPPSPEGHSYEELAEEHYTRQPLLLTCVSACKSDPHLGDIGVQK